MQPVVAAPAAPLPTDLNLVDATAALAVDLQRQMSPGLGRTIVIDPLLDARTGQQTMASTRVERELIQALATRVSNATVLKFDGAGAEQSRLLVSGTLTALPEPNRYRMSIALTDRQTGIVVAQAATLFVESGMDATPTRFYADSPSLVRDRSVEGYVRTAETPAGQAADPLYIEQIPTSALLADALLAFFDRAADAAPPFLPPFFAADLSSSLPRPEPLFFPPPVMSLTVAQAVFVASFFCTPRAS